ncbi:hypothetical protein [Sphingomonas sp.]|uniref:hypothetical protein n=1 Tax=Sphingomonas sp. TaxID=28214 RepID=UPI002DB8015A|nr:hypothetical protein [Sphingomonas sp.]HEU4968974.1 hypothetical protein [Sphingomonas sp.]
MNTVSMILLLLGVIAFVAIIVMSIVRNRKRDTPADLARTERATREFREQGADNAPENRVER